MAASGKILPFDFNVTARKLQTTLPEILPEVQEEVMRNYQMLALIESRGNVKYNCGGLGFTWKVKYRNHKLMGTNGENPRQWSQINQYQTAALDWRGVEVVDSISKQEVRQNKGPAAMINVIDGFEENLRASIRQECGPLCYNDGYDTTNPDYWHGLLSLFRQNGQTINAANNTARSRNDADKVIAPSGSYAELDCALGAYSGEQHDGASWPEGTADPHYDFWSPLMLQWDGTGFTGTTDGEKFKNAMRYGLTHAQRNTSKDGQLTQAWTDRTNYIALKDYYEGKQTIEVTSGTELYQLGFKDVIVLDGVEISWEAAVPVGFAFGVNMSSIELRGLDEQMFVLDGPEYDIDLKIIKAAVESHTNMLIRSPRNVVILAPKSAVVAA